MSACMLMSVSNKDLKICVLFQFCDLYLYYGGNANMPTHCPIQWLLVFRGILWGQSCQSMKLTTLFHLMPRLGISGAVHVFAFMPL
jgi:hypothetical protein